MKDSYKHKSHQHKEENSFKFETFNERLNKINFSSLNNLKRRLNEIDEDERDLSFFALALEKWTDLNCTNDFRKLRQKIGSTLEIQTLVQVIHKKDFLISTLLEGIKNFENQALIPILELLVAMARDLRSEFYGYFSSVFDRLVCLSMKSVDPDVIENVFVCQTFLFKYLWKFIIRDIEEHFWMFEKAFSCTKEYVVNFTSETFAFLLRRAKDVKKIFEFIFKRAMQNENLSTAIGRILFEAIKGINGNLNNKADLYLNICFEQTSESYENSLVLMKKFLNECLENLQPDTFHSIWKFLMIHSSDLSKKDQISFMVDLIHQTACFKKCKFVKDSLNLLSNCILYLFKPEIDEKTKKQLFQIIERLFQFKHEDLSASQMNLFCEKLFCLQNQNLFPDEILNFTTTIISTPIYDKILYKHVNKLLFEIFKSDSSYKLQAIEFLSYVIVHKNPRPMFGKEFNKIKKYVLDFEDNELVGRYLEEFIIESKDKNPELVYCCLIILGNIHSSNFSNFIKDKILLEIQSALILSSYPYDNRGNIYSKILFEIVIGLILQNSKSPITEVNMEMFLTFFEANPSWLELLQSFDIYLNYNLSISKEYRQELIIIMPRLYPIIEKNLSSPFRLNRIVALNILKLCNLKTNAENGLTIFQICLDAELTPVDLENYRERLRFIGKLDCNFVSTYIPESLNGVQFDMAPVHFILGTLYENLNVLWKPIVDVLETYAKELKDAKKIDSFVDVVLKHFGQTLQFILSAKNYKPSKIWKNINADDIAHADNSKPDHLNHRIWLLKSFTRFPNLIERRNMIFVNNFLCFLSEEFNQNSINRDKVRENISNQHDDDGDLPDETKINSKIIWKTFFSFLEVFELFKNPKAIYKESQIRQIYMNLLSSPNALAQKHAFNCLLTYNNLTKYKENFLRLIDDKSFSSEINSFMIHDNVEDNVIAIEDREQVVPYFLSILVGKMLASSGTKSHGKSKVDFLRSLIFKVLSTFGEKEQIMFMNLVYASLGEQLNVDYEHLEAEITKFINVEAFIPFKHFQSFITTLEFLMKHFGNNSVETMKFMMKMLIICSLICSKLLSQQYRSKIKDRIIESLKTFRTNCFKVGEYFFTNFNTTYPLSSIEIDLMFETLVKPLIKNLSSESQNFPTPLLRLFNTWSQNQRYFILLVKRMDKDDSTTPLSSIMQLYSNPNLSPTTFLFITNLIENLLTTNDQNEIINPIQINNFDHPLPNAEQYPQFKNINFGSLILIPYMKDIIKRIELNHEMKNNHKFQFTLQEINILARLSLFVSDPIDSKAIMILLLHSISRKKRPEEDKEIFTLKILGHLSNNLSGDCFIEILHATYDLFMLVEKPLPRRELGTFLLNLSKKNESFIPLANMIFDLNSFNPRFPEEPNYDRRISAFKDVCIYFENVDSTNLNEMQLEFIQLLFLNCAFFIHTYDDLSLKELSTTTIMKVSRIFKNSTQELFNEFVVNLVLFKIVSNGIRSLKPSVSSEFINLLIEVIRSFPSKNIFIDQLLSLCNEDEEMDFWQNIKHIQMHRRARALNRLVQNTDLLGSLSSRVYLNFLIPIVTNFINHSSQAGINNNLVLFNASIESLATYLQYCSWTKYDSILSYYVNGLLNNKIDAKIAIRIISALLEKFSFLKPEQVSLIEKSMEKDELEKISSEYSFDYGSKSSSLSNKKKSPKKIKNKVEDIQNEIVQSDENENKCEEFVEFDVDKTCSEYFQKDIRYYKKIYDSLCRKLLPLLHRCLHQKSPNDNVHELNKYEFSDDEEIQTIPIGLAIVKLLKHVQLDQRLFQINLNSIVLRLCQFLQSKAISIRETARKTLAQILEILGPKYFANIFNEMKILLSKGYQRHVFTFTVHYLLQKLLAKLNGGDLDDCMMDLIEVCHLELFGSLSEEKEVSKITTKTKEAKKIKAYDIYEILAQFCSEKSMRNLINPLKTVLADNSNHKTLKKIEKAFQNIGCGLIHNESISLESLIMFLNEIFVSSLVNNDEHLEKNDEIKNMRLDSFIIPEKSLRRVNQVSKVNRLSCVHILLNFALNCYLYILKNKKDIRTESYQNILNETLGHLESFLKSNDLKVASTALHCILLLLTKFSSLLSFNVHSQSIILQIFSLLQKHSGLDQENAHLTTLCFKTIAHFINIRSECKLSDEQIAILLSYADHDIENNGQNVAIFFLLKSIISRKFVSKEFHQLMERIMVMAITTDIDHVREHSIELYTKYLTDYPIHPNRLKGKLIALAKQLEVDILAGRKAAITILKLVIPNLSYDMIDSLKDNLFLILSSRLINEDSPECLKMVDETFRKLLNRFSSENLDHFFETHILPFLKSDCKPVQTMSSNLCVMFLDLEKNGFEKRIIHCLSIIAEQLNPEQFDQSLTNNVKSNQQKIKQDDYLLFSHLNFVLKLLKMENILLIMNRTKLNKYFDDIFANILSTYLLHPHTWIRSLSTQIFGQLFSLFDPELFTQENSVVNLFIFQNCRETLIYLARKFCLIFRDIYSCQFIAEQLIKNLVYIARVFIVLDEENGKQPMNDEDEIDQTKTNTDKSLLEWLIKKFLFETKFEIKFKPHETLKRILFVKWLAAVSLKLGHERIEKYVHYFLPSLCRENISSIDNPSSSNTAEESNDELKNLIKQVLQLFRNMLGSEHFIDLYNQTRNQISHQRLERRKKRAVQMVTNMVAGVKRKQNKHKRAQQSKKRKVNHFRISSL